MKVLGTFNQEKALVGAFSVIVKPMDRFTALQNCQTLHRVKIIDFGLARRLAPGRTSLPVTVCGTPEFIAPEVWR